jgi:hypothetical protein
MTGYMGYHHPATTHLNLHAIQQGKVSFQAERYRVLQMDTGGRVRGAPNLGQGTAVIRMTVGQEYTTDLIPFSRREDPGSICPGVHNGQLASYHTAEQVAVHGPGANLETLQLQLHHAFSSPK